MDYHENNMAAVYRCVLFAASGDGEISANEIEDATFASEGTEMYYIGYSGMTKALDSLFADLLSGLEGEGEEGEETEEEEEESLELVPLEKEQVTEIANDVLANIDKCDGASDLKAYASVCTSMVPEVLNNHIIRICFDVCGCDSPDWVPDKKEIRNIKYLCSELGVDFKEAQKDFLDSLTWYHDDLLGDDLKVETINKDFSDFEENSADAIAQISILSAYADGDFTCSYSVIADHWFLALCDIARSKGEKVVKVPEQIGQYIPDLTNAAQAPLHEKTGDPYALMSEEEPDWEKVGEIISQVPEYLEEVLAKALELISDKSLYKLTFKNASFLCESDEDSMTQHYMMDLFSGEQTKIQVNDMEEKALQQIGSHFGFDEDQLLGLRTRLENGELGSIYSAD